MAPTPSNSGAPARRSRPLTAAQCLRVWTTAGGAFFAPRFKGQSSDLPPPPLLLAREWEENNVAEYDLQVRPKHLVLVTALPLPLGHCPLATCALPIPAGTCVAQLQSKQWETTEWPAHKGDMRLYTVSGLIPNADGILARRLFTSGTRSRALACVVAACVATALALPLPFHCPSTAVLRRAVACCAAW